MSPAESPGTPGVKLSPSFTMPNTWSSSETTATQRNGAGVTDSIALISQDMRPLVQKIQDLRHLGIEDSKIALPKICVVGDQSTGKSSLIEGMSEIKVPRSAGTCTRCPMEINLSESEPDKLWQCRVILSRKYAYTPSGKYMNVPTRSLGPWTEKIQEDEVFHVLSDKSLLQRAIKLAQLAILNPGRPSSDFQPEGDLDDGTGSEVKFSPNLVRLDISAPGFPNLSFYDLPGVINQAEFDEESYLVTLVENLVKEYISQDNCIVLLTLPMTDDAMNSSAARIVRHIPGAKSRTLGVLTKPDRVQSGESLDQWMEILEGKKFELGHGYYVVRNNPDASVEHSQARDEEALFFNNHPWSTVLAPYSERFGVRRLQTALSGLLLEQIQGCLPQVIQQIDEKAERIDTELEMLPDPPSENLPYVLCGKLNLLKERIRHHIDGGSSNYPMQKIWGQLAQDFKEAITVTRPAATLISENESFKTQPSFEDDSECEMVSIRASVNPQGKRKTPGGSRPVDNRGNPRAKTTNYTTSHFEYFSGPAKNFTWEEIREINRDSYPTGIPGQTDPKAIEMMNRISVQHWDKPMNVFLVVSHKLVRDTLMEQVKHVFAQYQQTALPKVLERIILIYLNGLKEEHLRHAQEIYNIERHKPFTMATSALTQATKEVLEYFVARRREARARLYLRLFHGNAVDDQKRNVEIRKLISNDSEMGPDEFAQEVKMMASVRGYYDIASSRFVDSICQSVHTKLFFKCREELVSVIENELSIFDGNAMERCMELMAEDPVHQRRRQYLVREREKLTKAQEWLASAKKEGGDADLFGRSVSIGYDRIIKTDNHA
ncbi:hypothetical protein DTO166G4_7839 [Paecilomyces variotii]|nr:hypothetical protein DTO166G4_7839 [Paecilomyces variotii]KAJ9249507.1 hypothetical protein DTO207G8_6639 [Paecilomyces variotii]KAJ9380248.1 hypothetical protein DTO063F5_6695 [Paecilomyces variotii]